MRRVGWLILAVLLLGAGCGSGDKKQASDASSTTSTTASAPGATSSTVAPATLAAPNVSATGKDATAPAGSKPAAGGGGASGAQAGAASSNTPTPAAPGTYTYNRTGKATTSAFGDQSLDGPVSLKVDVPVNGEQTMIQSSGEGGTEQVVRFLAEGAYFTRLKQGRGGFSKEFRPDPAVLAVPGVRPSGGHGRGRSRPPTAPPT